MQLIKYILICFCLTSATTVVAQNADTRLLQHIYTSSTGADGFWRGVSTSDNVFVIATPTAMIIVGLAGHNRDLKIKAIETGGAILLAEASTFALKQLTARDRPFIAHPDLFSAKTSAGDYSFPSGHTSLAFATATSLSLAYPKWYVIVPSFAYAGAVGYSRMYLGVHYPSYVIGGALLGAGSAFLSFKLQRLLEKKIH